MRRDGAAPTASGRITAHSCHYGGERARRERASAGRHEMSSDLRPNTHCQTQPCERRVPPRPELRELNQISNLESTAALMGHRHCHPRCQVRPPDRTLIERRVILLISTPHCLIDSIIIIICQTVPCRCLVSSTCLTLLLESSHSSTCARVCTANNHASHMPSACLQLAHGACRRISRSLMVQLLKQGGGGECACPS